MNTMALLLIQKILTVSDDNKKPVLKKDKKSTVGGYLTIVLVFLFIVLIVGLTISYVRNS